ncbi:synaptotagmin-1-like isoform X2 [Rhopilema esculentum]|eukprot:gene14447-5506_t
MKKKKKKDHEKVKLKTAKPGKKLQRIQPCKIEKKAMEELGSLKFILRYDTISEMLMVTVMEAEDIPVRDLSGYAYSFVVAKVMNLHKSLQVDYKTKLVRAGFWPTFNDTIEIKVESHELEGQTLNLYLYEMNRWTKQDGIGQVCIALSGLGLLLGKEHVIKRKLKPYDPLADYDVETASVQLVLDYDSEDWSLIAEVVRADIIPIDESKEKEDSYVTLSLLNKDSELVQKLKTKTKKGTLLPEYCEELTFQISDSVLPDASLKIKLKSKRLLKVSKNPVIGETVIRSDSEHWDRLCKTGHVQGWFPVFKPSK